MTTYDLVYAIADRAKVIADYTKDQLYLVASPGCEGSVYKAKQELGNRSRGELIEIILTDEFIKEFPQNIE